MTKFKPAGIDASEIVQTTESWMRLWRMGDKNCRKITGDTNDEKLAETLLMSFCLASMEGNIFLNDTYQVVRRDIGEGMVHLSIRRLDRTHEHDWREFQQIKNELVGEECEGVELYPAESRLVDCANQWHIWTFSDPANRWPIGWQDRMVSEQPVGKSQQRPFNKEI